MHRHRLIHFLDVDTREPLCGGSLQQAASAAMNGVSLCDVCARRVTEDIGRVTSQQTGLASTSWRPGGVSA